MHAFPRTPKLQWRSICGLQFGFTSSQNSSPFQPDQRRLGFLMRDKTFSVCSCQTQQDSMKKMADDVAT